MVDPTYIGGSCNGITFDGTEGYASIMLTIKSRAQPIKTIGYFVKNNDNLEKYLKDNPPTKSLKFLVYFHHDDSEPLDWSRQLMNYKIEAHRCHKGRAKMCIIENNPEDPASSCVSLKKPHLFLPVCPNNFKKSNFVEKSSKSVTLTENISDGTYKGVTTDVKEIVAKSVEFEVLKKHGHLHLKDAGVLECLIEGPLLCKGQDSNWYLMGWYVTEQNRIKVYHLRAQGQ